MSPGKRPVVDCERHHTGLPVPDVMAAVEFYTEKHGIDYDVHASYRFVEE